jgi:hypothetical protein
MPQNRPMPEKCVQYRLSVMAAAFLPISRRRVAAKGGGKPVNRATAVHCKNAVVFLSIVGLTDL